MVLTLKDQNLSPALMGDRQMATTLSPWSVLVWARTLFFTDCQDSLLLGPAVCTFAPAAISTWQRLTPAPSP